MEETLATILSGTGLSPSVRVWSTLMPGIVLAAWFFGGLAVYRIQSRFRGAHHDAEIEARGGSMILGIGLRNYFAWLTSPVWRVLRWSQLPASAITTLSVLFAIGAGVAIAAGRFGLGGWLYILSGFCDFFDGRLARALGQDGPRGAALDSILDRFAEGFVLSGLAWYYRESWVLLPVLATLIGSMMVSYVRARGQSLGVDAKVGIMQRPERLVLLGAAVGLSPILAATINPTDPHPMHWLAAGTLVLMAVTTPITAIRRLLFVLEALGGPAVKSMAGTRRGGIWRSIVASGIATGADFALVVAMVEWGGVPIWLAITVGCILGAVINFWIGRTWAFESRGGALPQLYRYAIASSTSAGLNAGGVAVLMLLPVPYQVGWWAVRGMVFLIWNYPLQRHYVFEHGSPSVA
ncbi:MAG: phosphatidylglycerophosphate synthase/putative flippase GtrA [Bradymonadia bacterium]|jgi:phosphatidylglycerophosphate synthase/putative flippase GtrA